MSEISVLFVHVLSSYFMKTDQSGSFLPDPLFPCTTPKRRKRRRKPFYCKHSTVSNPAQVLSYSRYSNEWFGQSFSNQFRIDLRSVSLWHYILRAQFKLFCFGSISARDTPNSFWNDIVAISQSLIRHTLRHLAHTPQILQKDGDCLQLSADSEEEFDAWRKALQYAGLFWKVHPVQENSMVFDQNFTGSFKRILTTENQFNGQFCIGWNVSTFSNRW